MKKMLSILVTASLLFATSLVAHEESDSAVEQAVDYRQGLMQVMGWNMKRMGAMLKGKDVYDRGIFARRARDLNATAHLDVPAGFPDDSVNDESDAKDEIWLDWEEFVSKLDDMRNKASRLAKVATSDNRKAIKDAYADLGKSCKSCHKAFRK